LGARSVDEARRRVEADPSFVPVAVSTLLIGVTGFFRDADVFGALASQVIPPLASLPHPPRVWSAACSSGEELYSVGVLLEAGGLRDAELLGTDCRPDAIDEARACGGTRTFLEHLGPYLSTFALARLDLEAAVASVRGHARWKVSSIVDGVEPGPWDMVLWRNLAIYLTADAVARVYSRLVQAIRPGGFLVLGKAERPPEGMQLVSVARCIYRRTGGADAGP